MDHQPHAAFRSEPLFCHYSPLLLHCYLGNYSSFIKLIETLSPEELSLQLKKRETLMKVSPIFQPIIGIRSLTSDLWGPSHVLSETSRVRGRCNLQHKKVFKKLLELGADVNVHDVAGCTPLHYCSSKAWLRRFGPASSTLGKTKSHSLAVVITKSGGRGWTQEFCPSKKKIIYKKYRGIYFAKYYGGGGGGSCWEKKLKMRVWGKKLKRRGKGKRRKRA